MFKRFAVGMLILAGVAAISACRSLGTEQRVAASKLRAPYPYSELISTVSWDFSAAARPRMALGSDLWPCTWARDDNLYCAWGDGGGFDGNDDNIGRVSLGFARISGIPGGRSESPLMGKNVWGAPPYAEHTATFGGKVVSLISVEGILYAIGGFWTPANAAAPARTSGSGPLHSLAWSSDLGSSWQIAPWSTQTMLGTFLNFGRDNLGAIDSYVYIYYTRMGDTQRVFLKRVMADRLRSDPNIPGVYQYLSAIDPRGMAAWSSAEADAAAVFSDPNNVDNPEVIYDRQLRRYLLAVGHYPSGNYADASVGQLGIFEAQHPWGPWATVGYYDDWGGYGRAAAGDFLGVHLPNKWISDHGKTRWAIFSGLHELDSYNLARARLKVHRWTYWLRALVARAEATP